MRRNRVEIREKLIEIIVNVVEEDERTAAREYLKYNNDVSKLSINSVDYIKIIVDRELAFGIEIQDELYEMTYFSFFDLLYEYVKECVEEGTGGIRLLGKLREIKSVEEKIYQIVSDFCSGDMIENLKIVRDFNRIHLDFNMLDQILLEINRTYGVNLKKEAIINQEYGNINYLSRYIYQNKLRGEESDTV